MTTSTVTRAGYLFARLEGDGHVHRYLLNEDYEVTSTLPVGEDDLTIDDLERRYLAPAGLYAAGEREHLSTGYRVPLAAIAYAPCGDAFYNLDAAESHRLLCDQCAGVEEDDADEPDPEADEDWDLDGPAHVREED